MADEMSRVALSVCVTNSERLSDLAIKNGQLIFIRDKHKIAFDFKDNRTFYNQINELNTDYDRLILSEPESGSYYFVIETATLWFYQNEWIQISAANQEKDIFVADELPDSGIMSKLYVDKANKEIFIWDDTVNQFVLVANLSNGSGDSGSSEEFVAITFNDIDSLFSQKI